MTQNSTSKQGSSSPMNATALRFSPSLLASIFPFYLAINSELQIVHAGKVIQRICSDFNESRRFEDFFEIQRPTTTLSFTAIETYLDSLVILQVRSSLMLLKGQIVYLADQELLLFLGSPWLPDLDTLERSGLALTDFALHDPVADYLALLQTQKTALAETRKLGEQLKQQRVELREALEREKELHDLKSRFITTASHGFRTPLGIIASSTGILQDYATQIDNAMRAKHLSRIQSAVKRIDDLLDDVLTMSRIEAGVVQAHPRPFKLSTFCQTVIDEYQPISTHTLTCCIAPELMDSIVTLDQHLLNQILNHLLSNAIKYTPDSGSIKLSVSCRVHQILFSIQDSGIGIPVDDLTSIFEPFHRARNVGNTPGTGLGLAIVKHCVDLQNGIMAIASEPGQGTTITVTLPVETIASSTDFSEDTEGVVC